ncbi:helix-turn-helix transcriptional regulator [Chitinibacter sp. S2-10]|uniref:helix-turn-helix transcriptional regulator n=1 Tax=Chitinibacter sp. S2-10 TaxID=3373597 RepID=UPI0039772BBF
MSRTLYLISDDPVLLAHWQQSLAAYPLQQTGAAPLPAGATLIVDAACSGEMAWQRLAEQGKLQAHVVLLASSTPNDEEGYRALQLGFSGYCHAYAPAPLLEQIVEVIQSGEIWAGRSLVQRLLGAINRLPAQQNVLQGLSDREAQVARLTAKGLSNKEIARQLEITERTVKAHLTTIFEKLNVGDRVQLVLRVNGLV